MRPAVHRTYLAGGFAALLALIGCPSHQGTQARPQPQATAPTLPPKPPQPPPAEKARTPEPPQVTPAQPAPLAPAIAQRDHDLMASVEKAYHAGLSDYQQGHYASARSNFDYAVDLMLRCNCDLKNDQALSEEFDHIVDGVNTLELDALRQGNGLAPQAEPSPVDVAGNITTPANPSVTARATAELKTTQSDLPLVMNDYVAAYIDFFSNSPKGHATIVASLERMGRYKDMIERVLRQAGLPQDLIYQAVAESGFRPQAVNPRSGAGGMWQFMPWGTYGLERTAWYDQRFDPLESTEAYAREIRKMYDELGDWYLAMAAYDWGPGNIQKAVQRTGYADFWELYKRNNLPLETKNYVPIILAVTIMAKNPQEYGLANITPDPPLVTDTVATDYAVDLRLVSDIVGAPVQELSALNPSLLRLSTPPSDAFELHLPAGTAQLYEHEIAEIPLDKRRYWRLHTVHDGDSIESVAHAWHVSPSELAFVNQLSTNSDLSGVESLVIPLAPASASGALRSALYRPRRGDTLITIADRFGVTVQQLRRWNHLRSGTVTPGRRLYVAEPAHIYASSHFRRRHHTSRSSARRAAKHASTKKSASASHRSGKKKHG